MLVPLYPADVFKLKNHGVIKITGPVMPDSTWSNRFCWLQWQNGNIRLCARRR